MPVVFQGVLIGPSSWSASASSTSAPQGSMPDDSTPCPANAQSSSKRSQALGDELRDAKETRNKNKH